MIFRIFIGVIALLSALLIYDIGKLMLVKHAVYNVEESHVLGQKDGDLELVEFLDYSCRNCQNLHPVLMRTLERDGNVRYLIRPIHAGPDTDGTRAGLLVYAAGRQGKFEMAHNVLIENFRPIDDSFIASFAQTLQLDEQQLRSDMQDPELEEMLIDNFENLKVLKGEFVPALLMNGKVLAQVAGTVPDSDQILSLFNQARAL